MTEHHQAGEMFPPQPRIFGVSHCGHELPADYTEIFEFSPDPAIDILRQAPAIFDTSTIKHGESIVITTRREDVAIFSRRQSHLLLRLFTQADQRMSGSMLCSEVHPAIITRDGQEFWEETSLIKEGCNIRVMLVLSMGKIDGRAVLAAQPLMIDFVERCAAVSDVDLL